MAAHVVITLDTTGPQSPAVVLAGGAPITGSLDVSAAISSPDSDAVEVKIYGSVDDSFAPTQYRALEANAPWITLASPHTIRLASGDGAKTVKIKLRDDVGNVSAEATDSITVDTSGATITISSGPTPPKISKVTSPPKNSSEIVWSSDTDLVEYKVKAVANSGAAHTTGTVIPTTGGSTNVGAVTAVAAAAPITTTIKGADLEAASAGDGAKTVKVFGKDAAGNWSI